MMAAIHQPHYLPWLRYFDKIARSDVFVVLDTVQYCKNGWQNRNRVKTASGTALLTVPVTRQSDTAIDEAAVCDNGWRKKHWRTLEQAYCKAPYFHEHAPFLEHVYARPWTRLGNLNRYMLEYFVTALGIRTPVVYASEMRAPGAATERLINLIRACNCDRYYSGAYALEQYLDARMLADAGIALELQSWTSPIYPQLHGPFEPDLSIVDLLMNCGPRSLDILLGGPS